ncbi:helix-turn-helix domain-containing protein [Streptosporangium sp. G11]|uniref:helix-turn-helix domain-containing protein n=1 Tax=Streptosporangium sp. G11 TaxID=3436926 RepID=UPI003EBCE986
MPSPSDQWLTKDELAERFGLDSVHGIHRNTASGDWPAHKVLGKLRFSPEDVAEIERLITHPATLRRREATPPPPPPRQRRTRQTSASPLRGTGFADLTPRPLRDRRGSDST